MQTLEKSTETLPEGIHIVTVCDREGDMYELFDEADSKGQAFLIRIVQNRKTAENEKILDAICAKPCTGRVKTVIPRNSRAGVKEREAVLQIRHDRFRIKRPSILNKIKHLKDTREAAVIYVREEEQQNKAAEPVEWFLMTNEKIESVEDAAD